VYAHLDEEKEHDAGTWVLDTGVDNHMSGCRAAFMKLDTEVLSTMRFGDASMARMRAARLSYSCARTASLDRSKGCTSSLSWQPTS
jgi:hypothetical protein